VERQTSGLLNGTTCVIFDGNPGGSKDRARLDHAVALRAELGVTFFGAGAAFFANCLKAGVDLSTVGDLSRVRALGTTGSPLSPEAQQWGTAQFARSKTEAQKDIWWCNISGGTDFAGAFIGGHRELPQVPGEMQCRLMGCAVEAWNDAGEPVLGEVGELVCAAADSVDAAVLRGRHEQRAAALQLLRDVPAGPRAQARRR
jgi:acetoacetyl-CoA synthetase